MKRTKLLKACKRSAASKGLSWELFREGSNHSIYVIDGSTKIIVPRHNDINEVTALSILRAVDHAKTGGEDG